MRPVSLEHCVVLYEVLGSLLDKTSTCLILETVGKLQSTEEVVDILQ